MYRNSNVGYLAGCQYFEGIPPHGSRLSSGLITTRQAWDGARRFAATRFDQLVVKPLVIPLGVVMGRELPCRSSENSVGRVTGQYGIAAQDHPNHSERYATHQLKARIGMVAAMLHINGSVKSAINASAMNSPQNIFRSMQRTSLLPARCFAAGSADARAHPQR